MGTTIPSGAALFLHERSRRERDASRVKALVHSEDLHDRLGGVRGYLRARDPSPGAELLISAHLGGGEGLRPTLLGTLEAHLGASDPLRGGRV